MVNQPSKWVAGKQPRAAWMARAEALAVKGRRPFVYWTLVVFCVLYYYRPEDFIPVLNYIPMARIVAILGVLALLVGMLSGGKAKVPAAIKILWVLFFQMALCVPFALWRGGAYATVFEQFSKCVIVAMLISMAVVTVRELRKLLWIQVSAVAVITFFSIVLHHVRDGRLEGIQKGILENPNDLAINIAISFPLGLAFLLHGRGFKKVVWTLVLGCMSLGIVLTYSRSGLLAFLMCLVVCVLEFGIRGKRYYIVAATAVALILGLGAALSSPHYRARVESILAGQVEGSGDKGSMEARKELLEKSIMVAVTHPLVGIGPGCFTLVSRGWMVAHNSYTEVAAEAGFPALILFLLAIGAAFRNISKVRKSQKYVEDPEFRLLTQALHAALAAYLLGACFASTEYNLYIYVVVAYTCVMARIASEPLPNQGRSDEKRILTKAHYDRFSRSQPALRR